MSSYYRVARHRECDLEPGADTDTPRIPRLPANYATERVADEMLGLLARHAERQLPLLNQHKLHRKRQKTSHNSQSTMGPEAGVSALHPAIMLPKVEAAASNLPRTSNAGIFEKDKLPLTSPLVAFLGRTTKPESSRVIDTMTSPRFVLQESSSNDQLDPTASPRHTVISTTRHVPTLHATWRIQDRSPDSTVHALPSSPRQDQSDVNARAMKRPRLARRVSSQWRHNLTPQDRANTRERIMRSLHMHCQGDYEKLVLLLSSMDEELLHIKTTSNEFYKQQAFGLSDLIRHATLER